MIRMQRLVAWTAVAALGLVGCSGEETTITNPTTTTTQTDLSAAPAAPTGDIVATAISAGDFTTLVAAVQAAMLVDALQSPGPFTVFAPNDAAFAKLPPGTVNWLLLPENKGKLQELLLYHVVDGQVLSTDLRRFQRVKALSGDKLTIVRSRDRVRVNRSGVLAADILATNGVIHVVDEVLIPRGFFPKKRGDDDDSGSR